MPDSRPRILALVAGALVTGAAGDAQSQDTASARCELCPPRRVGSAVIQTLVTNAVINRFDVWVLGLDWARVSPSTWARNIRSRWQWDEDQFLINMLGHPYQGGLYVGAGRSNGLDFWSSAPLAFLGSLTWEYFGERTRPSINDLVNTGLGGIAVGEMSHRIAAAIRDNTSEGGSRLLREITALPLDPIGGLNRLFRGHWKRVGANPDEHDPGALIIRIGGGLSLTSREVGEGRAAAPILFADFSYGDPFIRPSRHPFDAFSIRAEQSLDGKSTTIRGSGRLAVLSAQPAIRELEADHGPPPPRGRYGERERHGQEIGSAARRGRLQWEVTQRFEYLDNPAYQFGGQALELGVLSRIRLRDQLWLRARVAPSMLLLAGIDAVQAGIGARDYDFGPGVGVGLTAVIEHRSVPYLTLHYQPGLVQSINGSDARHRTTFANLEAFLPLGRGLGLALHAARYTRSTAYPGRPDERRSFPELRLLAWYKIVSRPPAEAAAR